MPAARRSEEFGEDLLTLMMKSFTVALLLALQLASTPAFTPQQSSVAVRLRGVSAVSSQVAWASGADNTILRTDDGGSHWRRLPSPSADRLDFRDVDAIDPRTAFVLSIGSGSASRIYKTMDAGATWHLQFTNRDPDAFFDAMSFWDARHGLAVSDSVAGVFPILRTDDGGGTWNRVPAAQVPPALPNEGAFAASGTSVTIVGSGLAWIGTGAADRARVLRSTDWGRTWQVADTPVRGGPSAGIFSIAFRDAQHGVIVGGDHTKERDAMDNAAVTSDGGITWTRPAGAALSGFRSVVSHVPGTAATFIALGPLGGDISTDDGRSWRATDVPGADTMSFAPGSTTGFAAGAGGRILRVAVNSR